MVTNGVWMDTGGREDTGRQENESHVGARRDTRGENVRGWQEGKGESVKNSGAINCGLRVHPRG